MRAERRALGWLIALASLAGVVAILRSYPLTPWPLAAAVAVYAGLVWRWPGSWLVLLPALVPSVQFAPWTGWLMIVEPDLFMLATLGVLAVRAPPRLADFRIGRGWGTVLALFVASGAISLMQGWFVPEPLGGTSDLYMSAWNGVRLVKPQLEALALLPFAWRRQRTHGDALALFAGGMALGLVIVSLIAGAERLAFAGFGNFDSEYRPAAPFASMHVGGGHIGAYVAMALPFTIVLLLRGRVWSVLAFVAVSALGVATLGLTFARTAYGAGIVGILVTALALTAGARGRGGRAAIAGVFALVVAVVGVLSAASLSGSLMTERIRLLSPDLAVRTANWREGLAMLETDPADLLFGMGTGTYLRLARQRGGDPASAPSDFVIRTEAGQPVLTLRAMAPLYFGQKVAARPGETVTISLQARSFRGATLDAVLCEKYLLFSADCADLTLTVPRGDGWTMLTGRLRMPVPAEPGLLPRPADLSLVARPDDAVDLTAVRLVAADGRGLLANGDFSQGGAHWFFTSDNHVGWRILNQYLMTLLEQGVVGLVALIALFVAAIGSAFGALRGGEPLAAALVGAIATLAVSFLFDAVLEAQSLSWLIMMALGLIAARSSRMRDV